MTKKWEMSCNGLFAILRDRYCLLTLSHWKKLPNKTRRHPTSAINECVTLYRNLTQSNTVEKDQKTGEVLQRPFLNTSRLLILLDTFASKNIAELKKMSSHKNNKQMSYAIPKPYAIKHCRKRPKKGRGVAMAFSQYFTTVIACSHFRIEISCGIKKDVTPQVP